MKKVPFLSGFIFSVLLLFFINPFQNSNDGNTYNSESVKNSLGQEIVKTTNIVPIETDTLDALTLTAEIGVNGIITNAENYIYEDENGVKTPYTKLTVLVDHVYKGEDTLLNTEITILEFGGVISKEDLGMGEKFPNMTKKELDVEVVVQSEGLPNSREEQEIVAFLMKSSGMNTGFDFYQFTADYLSKFYFDEKTGSYERLVPDDNILDNKQSKEEQKLNDEITEIIEEELTEEEI